MGYLFLIATVLSGGISSACAGFFDRRFTDGKNRMAVYNLILIASVALEWAILWAVDFSFEPRVIPYALVFSAGYTLATTMIPLCLRNGPLSLTSLVVQVSVACVTVWGFFFWEDTKLTVFSVVGLVLVVVALAFCISGKKGGSSKFNGKWILFAALAFLGNAACSIAQRQEQLAFPGVKGLIMDAHGPMMMCFATAVSLVVGIVRFFLSKRENTPYVIKRAGFIPFIAGTLNVVVNMMMILLVGTTISPALIYPVVAVGSLAVSILISLVFFREKLRPLQWIGLGLGAVAVVLLKLG